MQKHWWVLFVCHKSTVNEISCSHQVLESWIIDDPSFLNFAKLAKIKSYHENSQDDLKMKTDYLAIHQSYNHGYARNWWWLWVINVTTSLQHEHFGVWSPWNSYKDPYKSLLCLYRFLDERRSDKLVSLLHHRPLSRKRHCNREWGKRLVWWSCVLRHNADYVTHSGIYA